MDSEMNVEPCALLRSECLELLGSATTGRLSVTRRALPVIVPVRMRFEENEMRVESILGDVVPLTTGSVVALETGTIGDGRPGWTVQVCGFLVAGSRPGRSDSLDALATTSFQISLDGVSGWRVHAP